MKKTTFMKPLQKFIGLFTILYLYSLESIAQSSGFGTPSDSDMSVQFLGQIFGGLVGGGQDAFGSSIATFNSAVLIVGGLLVGYTIFAGTLGTAHDGEMLGKKFSSVWVPIRTVLGTALVLPVMKGGYCTMQALVMWLVLQGISLANMVWTSYAGSAAANNIVPAISRNKDPGSEGFVKNTYAIAACVAAQKKADEDTRNFFNHFTPDATWEIYDSKFKWVNKAFNNPKTKWAGNSNTLSTNWKACGTITYPEDANTEANVSQGNTNQTSNNVLGSIAKLQSRNIKIDTSAIYNVHLTQTEKVIADSQTLAAAALTQTDGGVATLGKINAMETAYNAAVNDAAQAALGKVQNTLSESAESEGWFTAGTFATKIILAQNTINSAIAATGEASPTVISISNGSDKSKKDVLSQYMVKTRGFLPYWGSADAGNKQVTNSNGSGDSRGDAAGDSGDWSFNAAIIKYFSGLDFSNLQSDNRHPILIAQTMGTNLIESAVLFEGAAIAAQMTAAVAETGSVATVKLPAIITSTLPVMATFLHLPLSMFMATGAMLAYAVPMTPLFLWVGIIIGWSLMVVEAVLAAPLWAVMHLHPAGDDMTGKGGSGYMLVLGLVVRPALIIFGLIAAITLSGLFGQYLNAVFLSSFAAPKTYFSIITSLMMAVIYTTILLNIIKTTFSLMHQIPDQLLRWIGGGSEQLGQFASTFGPMAMEKASAAAGAVAGGVTQTAGSAAKGLGEGLAKAKRDKDASTGAMNEGQGQMQNAGMNPTEMDIIGKDHARGSKTGAETLGAQKAKSERINIGNATKQIDGSGELSKATSDEYVKLRTENPKMDHNEASAQSVQNAFDSKFGEGSAEKMGVISKDKDGNLSVNQGKLNELGAAVSNQRESMTGIGASAGQVDNMITKSISGSDGSIGSVKSNLESNLAEFKSNTPQPASPDINNSGKGDIQEK